MKVRRSVSNKQWMFHKMRIEILKGFESHPFLCSSESEISSATVQRNLFILPLRKSPETKTTYRTDEKKILINIYTCPVHRRDWWEDEEMEGDEREQITFFFRDDFELFFFISFQLVFGSVEQKIPPAKHRNEKVKKVTTKKKDSEIQKKIFFGFHAEEEEQENCIKNFRVSSGRVFLYFFGCPPPRPSLLLSEKMRRGNLTTNQWGEEIWSDTTTQHANVNTKWG